VSTYNAVPGSLKDIPNWIVWKHEIRNGKEAKIPYDAKRNGDRARAKVNDSATWTTFERAAEVADVLSGHDYNGIGIMLRGTHLVGLDFDGVLKDGKAEPFVLDILENLGNPYCEITPSENGLRAFVEYPLALPAGNRKFSRNTNGKYGAEIYSGSEGGRYLTVTGNKLSGNGIPKIADINLVYFMVSQITNEKFKSLWMGDLSAYGDDQSRADLALLGVLAQVFDNNRQKMEWAFGASKLGQRDKWTKRKDYRDRTIAKALSGNNLNASPTNIQLSSKELQFHLPAVETGTHRDYVVAPIHGQRDGLT
jgi:primase-polymerase (primpol)-like protein